MLVELFQNFSRHFGLKVNLAKSMVTFSTGVSNRKIEKISTIISIRYATSLDKYLGFICLRA